MDNHSHSKCNLTDSFGALSFTAYVVVAPIYFVIGVLSRSICLVAFYKQSKKEKAYAYQCFASFSELLEVITVSLCMATRNNLAGYRLAGAAWFQGSYPLMWYAAHLASPLEQGLITTSLLISLSVAADRVFAMAKPFVYKDIDHRRHQVIAAVASFTLGLSTSAFDAFRYHLHYQDGRYEIAVTEVYIATAAAFTLAALRNSVRIVGNATLVVCNTLMVVFYRLKVHKIAVNEKRAAKRKSTHRTLVLLTLCQSIFVTANLTMFNVYYSLAYRDATFTNCFGKVMAPVDDLVLQIAAILEVFVLLAVSRKFRAMITITLRCEK